MFFFQEDQVHGHGWQNPHNNPSLPYKTMLESKSGLVVGKMLKNCVIMTVQLSMTIYCL